MKFLQEKPDKHGVFMVDGIYMKCLIKIEVFMMDSIYMKCLINMEFL